MPNIHLLNDKYFLGFGFVSVLLVPLEQPHNGLSARFTCYFLQ